MAAKLENEYGVISIDREVIARIAAMRRLNVTALSAWLQKM